MLACLPARPQVVNDKELFMEWNKEMKSMAGRIDSVRKELQRVLTAKYPAKDWGFITQQIGMFSFTGLSPAQVCKINPLFQPFNPDFQF